MGRKGYPRGAEALPEGDACAKAQGERGRLGRGAGGKVPRRQAAGQEGSVRRTSGSHFILWVTWTPGGCCYHSHSLLLMIGKILKAVAC